MKVQPCRLLLYETPEGRCPWREWFDGLKDRNTQAAIDARLLRLQRGNFGDCRSVGGGIWELRVHLGAGYRIYFGRDGLNLVVLLCGGSKGSQKRDVERARVCWSDYRS